MNFDILVPITFLLVVGVLLREVLRHRHMRRNQVDEILSELARQGTAVPEDVVARLALSADPRRTDLRRSIVLAVSGLVVGLMAWLLPFESTKGALAFASLAIIPLAFSLLYLVLWKFWYRTGHDETN